MPTQRVAFSCALAALILFSCNSKKNRVNSGNGAGSAKQLDTVTLLADEPVDINACNTSFIDGATQRFTADENKISVITAKGKLKVVINPSVLEKEDGSAVDGKINVSIIELTNSNDLFKSNAATISDGWLLASGGSYFIGMESGGKKLRIKNGRSMRVDFPMLTNDEMELFYGERNSDSNMNWRRAGVDLIPRPDEEFQLSDYSRTNNDFPVMPASVINELKLYRTLDEQVYYYNKKMTLREIVDTINRYSKKVYIDTVYAWPKELANLPKGTRVDTNYLNTVYGPRNQFFLKRFKQAQEEKEKLAKEKAIKDSLLEKWQPQSLSGQIQKYYSPSSITALGWINCDRFYQPRENTDVEVDLPVTLNDSHIKYFLLFKSINGLMNLYTDTANLKKKVFHNLPLGESVILIGFTKEDGQLFHCKEEFVIQKNKPVKLNFKNISPEEMIKMFGKNVRI